MYLAAVRVGRHVRLLLTQRGDQRRHRDSQADASAFDQVPPIVVHDALAYTPGAGSEPGLRVAP